MSITKQFSFPDSLFNDAFLPYLYEISKPIEILFGGAGSSKTIHSCVKDIFRVLSGKNILVVRQVYGTIEDSYYNDLKKVTTGILDLGAYFKFKKSPLRIECTINKKVILFRGLDDVEKLKGISVPVGTLDHFTIEEATETHEESTNQLQFRTRGGGEYIDTSSRQTLKEKLLNAASLEELQSNELKNSIYEMLGFDSKEEFDDSGKSMTLLFNPVAKTSWVFKRFFTDSEDKEIFDIIKGVYISDNMYIMHSTHWDNGFLTYDDHVRYESYRFINQYFYNVYCLGNWGVLGDIIFEKVKLANFGADFIATIPEQYVGLDFGNKDPNALVRTGIDRVKKEIYILDEFVGGSMSSSELADVVIGFTAPNETVWCDSAGRQQIHDLQTRGINALAVIKYGGANFKPHGISVLWEYTIYVSTRCKTFASEIMSYTWKKDRHGNVMNVPDDGVGANHQNTLDAGLFYTLNPVLLNTKRARVY